jgi:hypothetical protein
LDQLKIFGQICSDMLKCAAAISFGEGFIIFYFIVKY